MSALALALLLAQTPPPPPVDVKALGKAALKELVESGAEARVLKVGAQAPDFTLPDAQGRPVKLSTLLAKGPVVVTFYRGAWCPYCNVQLGQYQERLKDLQAAGAQLVAISPQLPDFTAQTAKKHGLGFPVLSDRGNAVARTYGLVYKMPDALAQAYKEVYGIDLEIIHGDTHHELPMPGTFVLDAKGIVRLAFAQADYTRRLTVEDLLVAVKGLAKTR